MSPEMRIRIFAWNDTGPGFAGVVSDAKKVGSAVASAGASGASSMKTMGGSVANLSAQFQDVAVQLQSGTSPLQIALQQGTQVSAVLGPLGAGGAVRALGAAFMSLLSPVTLITIGSIAAGGALIQWLGGLNRDMPKADDALKVHEQWIGRILQGYEAAGNAAKRAAQQAMVLPQGVVLSDLGANLVEQAAKAEELQQRIGDARVALQETTDFALELQRIGDSLGSNADDALAPLLKQLDLLRNIGLSAKSDVPEIQAAMTAARELFNTAEDPAIRDLAAQVYELGQNLYVTYQQGYAARAAIAAIANGPTLDAVTASAERAAKAIAQLADLKPELRSPRQLANAALNQALGSGDAVMREAARRRYGDTLSALDTQDARDAEGRASVGAARAADHQADAYQRVVDTLADERAVLGMTAREAEKFNQVRAAGIDAASKEAEAIRASVDALYDQKELLQAAEDAGRANRNVIQSIAGAAKSFAADFRSELRQSGDAWGAFAQAGLNALDRLQDKLVDAALDGAVQLLVGPLLGVGGGAASFLGSLFGVAAADGGLVRGPGTGTSDSVPALLSNGEYVVNARAAAQHGDLLDMINGGGSLSPGGPSDRPEFTWRPAAAWCAA